MLRAHQQGPAPERPSWVLLLHPGGGKHHPSGWEVSWANGGSSMAGWFTLWLCQQFAIENGH